MRYPDTATVLRPTGTDAYGNAGAGERVAVATTPGFLSGSVFFAPPWADVDRGDHLAIGADTYAVQGDPVLLRSPSRAVLTRVSVQLIRR